MKHKSWHLEYPVSDGALMDTEAFIKEAVEVFRAMKPFNDYLNRALEKFEMPAR